MIWKRKNKDFADFKPDVTTATWLKTTRLTQQQRLRLTKWGCYVLTMVLALVIQDTIMSQFRLFGATTDLAVCVILLITVLEGTDVGSLFVLLASSFYYFSGSAPGIFAIPLITVIAVITAVFRQAYLRKGFSTMLICTGTALFVYEIGTFLIGLFLGSTIASRFPAFLIGAGLTLALVPLLYPILLSIGKIGGETWKE